MKLRFKNLSLLALLLGMILGLYACDEKETYVQLEAQISCTSDLLEVVSPVVTIEANGRTKSVRLTKDDFKKTLSVTTTTTVNININGEESGVKMVSLNYADVLASVYEKYEDETAIKGTITVKYERIPDATLNKEAYVFNHGVGYRSEICIDDKKSKGPEDSFKSENNTIIKEEVEEYISELIASEESIAFDVK